MTIYMRGSCWEEEIDYFPKFKTKAAKIFSWENIEQKDYVGLHRILTTHWKQSGFCI